MLITSPNEMYQLGVSLSKIYTKILLIGDLGAGKTTFTKGFVAGLGYNPDEVQSPTYTYLHIYAEQVLHIDMYRLESREELYQLGIADEIDHHDVVIIERPKWTDIYMDPSWVTITLARTEQEGERMVMIT